MFEAQIQNAWDRYYEDFGFGRIFILICLFNVFLFVYTGLSFNVFNFRLLYPIPFAAIFYLLRNHLIHLSPLHFIGIFTFPIALATVFNYLMIGYIDLHIGQFTRMDPFFSSLDFYLFNDLAAEVIHRLISPLSLLSVLFYDILITSYIFYFFLPFIGFAFYYRHLPVNQKYKVGRYIGSVVIFFCLNYLLYIIFPVTGPQYYMKELTEAVLPFSVYGAFLYNLISDGHPTFIDCFPSGHFGMSLLVTFWFFRINHMLRFFFAVISLLIMLATLAMYYHYILDLVGAIPLALISYGLGKILIPSKAQVVRSL